MEKNHPMGEHPQYGNTTNRRDANNSTTCCQQFHHQWAKFCHVATSGHVEMLGPGNAEPNNVVQQHPIESTVLTTRVRIEIRTLPLCNSCKLSSSHMPVQLQPMSDSQ